MKKWYLFALLGLAACSNNTTEEYIPQENELVEVSLSFPQFTITQEEMPTRATANVSTVATHLDVWLIEGENTIELNQATGDEGFGSISLTLDKTKTYTLYAIAHKGSAAATLSDGIITFPDNKVTHSFWYTTTFSPGTTTALSCTMNRIVGQFKLETADEVPIEVTKFRFSIPQTFTAWSTTGIGANKTDRVSEINLASRNQDGTATFNVFIIGSSEQELYDITVAALNSNNEIVKSHILEDVPIKNNYRTTARGIFFTDEDVNMSMSIDDSWNEFDQYEY